MIINIDNIISGDLTTTISCYSVKYLPNSSNLRPNKYKRYWSEFNKGTCFLIIFQWTDIICVY